MNNYYGVVYQITNTVNNKIYIGKTVQPVEKRFYQHLSNAENGYTVGDLSLAISKHGTNNFIVKELCYCFDKNTLLNTELDLIDYFLNSGYILYNGKLKYGISDSYKKKIKLTRKANRTNKNIIDTINVNLNRELIQIVDKFIKSQNTRVFASRKQFIELAIVEKLESLTNKEQE